MGEDDGRSVPTFTGHQVRDVIPLHPRLSVHASERPARLGTTKCALSSHPSLPGASPSTQWTLFEETPMRRTELPLQSVSVVCMVAAERLPKGTKTTLSV